MFCKNKILIFVYLLLFIFLEFFILKYLFSYSFIFVDDLDLVCKNIKGLFINPDGGIYLSSILGRLFSSLLPNALNMHPSFFKANYYCNIEAVLFIILFISITNLLYLNRKINILYPLAFLFTSALIMFFIQEQYVLLLFIYEGFYRMLFPAFLMGGGYALFLS